MTDTFRPGTRVTSKDDATYTGVVVGPSGYYGGSKIRFDNGQTYPASHDRLTIESTPDGLEIEQDEKADFDNWQYFQSDGMIRKEDKFQLEYYRLDTSWHHRIKGKPYNNQGFNR
jgi:hypothetical protein